MNAAVMMQSCPGEETLAAFIDQRLDPASRLEVVKHLAECGDCRDMIVAANEYQSAEGVERKVAAGTFGPRMWVPLAAAAALVGVLFGVPAIREKIIGSPMNELVEVANGLPKRPAEGRFSADFAHRDYSAFRGGEKGVDSTDAPLKVQIAALDALAQSEKDPTPANLHAAGVARLFLRHLGDESVSIDDAVHDLERAAKASPRSAVILNDLAAAYIARGDDASLEQALKAATEAWSIEQTSAAAWNRALALQRLRRDRAAIEAWQRYLERDPDSPWSVEVKNEHLNFLQEP